MTRAYIGLGSNLGERLANLSDAVRRLHERGVGFVHSSRVYETQPVGGPPQPDFLNAVIEVETDLKPRALLQACLGAEDAMGRERTEERWGPRSIDIDILSFGDEQIDEPDLQIPHPRMHERGFVVIPLFELEADPMIAGGGKLSTTRMSPLLLGACRPFAPPLALSDSSIDG
ncbi:MAG: 2-amino-4-hydroxy-6-hydroxymethyldihydropteridine diphosphokinase [Actinomycetota bacterium]